MSIIKKTRQGSPICRGPQRYSKNVTALTFRSDNESNIPRALTNKSDNCYNVTKAITLRSDNATNFPVAITVQSDNGYTYGQSDNDTK